MAKTIADYKKDYENARANGDYAGMQAANDGANAIRRANGEVEEYATGDIANVKYAVDNGYDIPEATNDAPIYGTQNKKSTSSASSASSVPASSYDSSSDAAYQQAIAALQAVQKAAPTYANSYDTQLQDLYNQIVNRDKFQYDINSDMLYQQYAQQYANNGRLAMQDTMGQAAALTGGYGSSYGQAVGQQQYDAYMQQLNDVIPELYQQAYQQYQDEGDRLLTQYSMLGDMADDEYAKYQDQYNQWLTERDYALNQADTAYNRGYQNWADSVDIYNANRDYELNKANADREYQLALEQFAYGKEQDAIDNAYRQSEADREYQLTLDQFNWQKEQAAAANKAATTGSTNNTGGTTYDTHGYTTTQIKALQKAAGIKVDGIWGPNTQKAYEAGYRPDSGTKKTPIAYEDDDTSENDNTGGTSFKTYSEAVAYMKANGVTGSAAASILTESEWKRRKAAGSTSAACKNYSTYQAYLNDIVEYNLENK